MPEKDAKDAKKLRLYRGKRDVTVTLGKLFRTWKSIEDSGTQEAFLAAHGDLSVTAEPHVVNAVKSHLFAAKAHLTDPHAEAVVTSQKPAPGEPPTCTQKMTA